MGASQTSLSNETQAELVSRIQSKLNNIPKEKARAVGGVFLFNIIKGRTVSSWTLDLNQVIIYDGEPAEDPDTTFTLNDHYFKLLVSGKEDPKVIIQAGKCSVTGNVMKAFQLEPFIRLD